VLKLPQHVLDESVATYQRRNVRRITWPTRPDRNLCDELIAVSAHRADPLRLIAAIAEDSTKLLDRLGDGSVGNFYLGPDTSV
jgi:hypothetical protein